ncbi:efflux RND transporter permease subunit [Hyphomonas johnsonii]|uniref:CzcA family heavy metal efflux pump n=1 Tax=Hyphomonas johnsonii MHS-2 TaxID=1280950 RepID=A0A059FBI1_9PROT|nr:CusA/CzcA family heavy metal efflux RND transporter [Hyphomonas johnsonii]KCZ87969.1 CzcA family heavy metal efflux pump [Hyphomonas johnsonii MHS-2]
MPDNHIHDLGGRDPAKSAIAKLISWSVSNQLIVLVLCAGLAFAGWMAVERTPLDAVPDLTDTQVIIRTDFPGQSPQIVEDLVTYPLSTNLLGLPKTKDVRGSSMFGTSFVYVIFEDGVDLYWARSRVLEALSRLGTTLPDGVVPQLGPDATGVGWVYQYALVDKTGNTDLAELRSLQDWFLKLELSGVAGVSEVASVGGFVREYQVLVDPNLLRSYDISLRRVSEAVKTASSEVGGRVLEQGESEFVIRSSGYVDEQPDLEQVVLYASDGTPVLLSAVARIVEGPALRRGIVELNGEGETVAGIVIMRDGENALTVIDRVKAKLAELQRGLPEGVEIVTVYDRAPLIEGAVEYLKKKLLEEGVAVAFVILIFLLHVRSSLVAIITLPLGVLGAFLIMSLQGVTANIMSLGGIAIAIGAMVDASIVLVENGSRKLADLGDKATTSDRRATLLASAQEVGPGIFFSLLIITVSFLPVFALTGESYRLFSPLAFTKTYAMAFAAILSVTLVPVLMHYLMRGKFRPETANPLNRFFIWIYKPLLHAALRFKWVTLAIALLLTASVIIPAQRLGTEFMPALYEGELLYMPTTLPGVSSTKMREILGQTNRLLMTVPEVERVFGKAGRADTATDPAPLTMIETWIKLKPKSEWRPDITVDDITAELDARLQMPGLVNSWGYPIKIRMDMVSTGVRTPIGIKVTGDDLVEIERIARDIEAVVSEVPGTRSAFADRVLGGKYLDITPDRAELARRNIDMGVFQTVVQTALGGMRLAQSVEGRERYNIILRYDRPFRESPGDLESILVPTPTGAHIPLGDLATIAFNEGPPMIRSENARLTGWVFVDIAGRDMGGFVSEARQAVTDAITLPPGYAVEFAGQYKQMEEAAARLQIAIPAAVMLIFLLLMLHFGRLDRTAIIMLSLPFGMVGGLWAVWLAGYNLSVAVAVGFIALGGIAVETAVIMLLYIDGQVREEQPTNRTELFGAISRGAAMRVRPKLMTVLTILVGLSPVFLTDGLGADVMRRIALPMLGGMVSTLLLTLIVIPAIYYIWVGRSFSVCGVLQPDDTRKTLPTSDPLGEPKQ